jgi:hypothetical protein
MTFMRTWITFACFIASTQTTWADAALDKNVLNLFEGKCAECHSPTKFNSELTKKPKKPFLDGTTSLSELSQNYKVVHPGDATTSKLYKVITLDRTDKDRMPHSTKANPREPLSNPEVDLIKSWIESQN